MTATVTYRKTKSGQWVAFGPVNLVVAGQSVVVTKKSGQAKTEHIESVGHTFQVDGVTMVYGYLEQDQSYHRPAPSRETSGGGICDECDEPRRNLRECRDSSGLVGRCCPRCASMADYERSFA